MATKKSTLQAQYEADMAKFAAEIERAKAGAAKEAEKLKAIPRDEWAKDTTRKQAADTTRKQAADTTSTQAGDYEADIAKYAAEIDEAKAGAAKEAEKLKAIPQDEWAKDTTGSQAGDTTSTQAGDTTSTQTGDTVRSNAETEALLASGELYSTQAELAREQWDLFKNEGLDLQKQAYEDQKAQWDKQYESRQNQWQSAFDRAGNQWQQGFDRQGDQWDTRVNQWQQGFDRQGDQWERAFARQGQRWDEASGQWERSFDNANQQWNRSFDRAGDQWNRSFDRTGDQWNRSFDRAGDQWERSFDNANQQWGQAFARQGQQWDQNKAWMQEHLDRRKELEAEIDRSMSAGAIAVEEGRAASDVRASFDQQRSNLMTNMARYGMRPGSGRFNASMRTLGLGEAAGAAGARNDARVGILERGRQNQLGLHSMGAGQVQMSNPMAPVQQGVGPVMGPVGQAPGPMMGPVTMSPMNPASGSTMGPAGVMAPVGGSTMGPGGSMSPMGSMGTVGAGGLGSMYGGLAGTATGGLGSAAAGFGGIASGLGNERMTTWMQNQQGKSNFWGGLGQLAGSLGSAWLLS